MRRALSGSALLHAIVLGVALLGLPWPEPDDAPAAEAVSVSIIAMSSVSANATQVVQSDSTVNLTASGAAASAPPTLEPIEPDMVEPVTTPVLPLPAEPQQPEAAEPLEPLQAEESGELGPGAAVEPLVPQDPVPGESSAALAQLSSTAASSLASPALAALPPPMLEPLSSAERKAAPVPRTLSFERPDAPTPRQPAPTPPKPRTAAPQPSQTGNGGANDADAVASAGSTAQQADNGSGGDADVARYPSEVLRQLRRALRSSNGPRGEVVVRFTVLADGRVSGISIGRSSGNAVLDQAGLATVSRAAPFPPIPPAANRADWTFDVPLAFGG